MPALRVRIPQVCDKALGILEAAVPFLQHEPKSLISVITWQADFQRYLLKFTSCNVDALTRATESSYEHALNLAHEKALPPTEPIYMTLVLHQAIDQEANEIMTLIMINEEFTRFRKFQEISAQFGKLPCKFP